MSKTKWRRIFELRIVPLVKHFIEIVLLVISFLFTIWCSESFDVKTYVAITLWSIVVLIKIIIFIYEWINKSNLQKTVLGEKLSYAMLKVQQQVASYKSRHVLQITYKSVPKWRPFNYRDNILLYDVHEQIRTILLEFKNAIISITPGLESEAITVDLVYCYPDNNYDGSLPTSEDNIKKWKTIGSRDGSSINYLMRDILNNKESFYNYLEQNNYLFFNDKFSEKRHYIPIGKDYEYGLSGSIVGLTLNVKNDAPKNVLVKAMLTVTTYGTKLYEPGNAIKESDYKELFRKYVLYGCKSMLESELSQMYIRHMIREGNMCPYSGDSVICKKAISNKQRSKPKKLRV